MAAAKPRIYLWDNVKALLIFTVVLGHFINDYSGDFGLAQNLFTIIYWFHMPLFIFVSGLFSKSTIQNGFKWNRVISYLILYVALKVLVFLVPLCFGKVKSFTLLSADGVAWYMFAMAAFLTMTWVLHKVKPWILLPLSIAAALLAGWLPKGWTDFLCVSRIFVFFPLFLLGYFLDSGKLVVISRKPWLRIGSAVVLIAFVVLAFTQRDLLYSMRPVLTARNPYVSFPIPELGPLLRLFYYATAGILSFAIICVLPNRKTIYSYIGASTLPIYFFHRPILTAITYLGLPKWLIACLGNWGLCIFFSLSIVLTLALSWKPLNVPFQKLMQCQFGRNKLIRNRSQ